MTDNNKQRNTHTMTFMKIGIGVAIAACAAVIAVPALKGPINRYRNEANERLNAEYVVDNYKAEYVKLHSQKAKLIESISKFDVEKKVSQKKAAAAQRRIDEAKANLKSVGTSDMKLFNRSKDAYELAKTEFDNFTTMVKAYTQAVKKLEKSLALVDANMAKAKLNVDTLSSKKIMLDTIKSVNKTIENMNGVGDADLAINIEKLDDDTLRESIRLEALDATESNKKAMTEAEAKAYIDSLK